MPRRIILALMAIIALSSCKSCQMDPTPPDFRHTRAPYSGDLIRTDGYYYRSEYDTNERVWRMFAIAFFRDGQCLFYDDVKVPGENDLEYLEQMVISTNWIANKEIDPHGIFWVEQRTVFLENPEHTGRYSGRKYDTYDYEATINRDGSLTPQSHAKRYPRVLEREATYWFREYHGLIKRPIYPPRMWRRS